MSSEHLVVFPNSSLPSAPRYLHRNACKSSAAHAIGCVRETRGAIRLRLAKAGAKTVSVRKKVTRAKEEKTLSLRSGVHRVGLSTQPAAHIHEAWVKFAGDNSRKAQSSIGTPIEEEQQHPKLDTYLNL